MHCVSILWIILISIFITIAKNNQKIAIKQSNGFSRHVTKNNKSSNQLKVIASKFLLLILKNLK